MILKDILKSQSKLPYNIDKHVKELDDLYQNPHNINFKYPDDAIGIEIELENAQTPYYQGKFWLAKEDGSLRNNGIEYVTPIGLSLKYIKTALEELFSFINETIETSSRTSVHIHMNVLNLTEIQIKNLISIYGLAEYSLYEFAGSKRYKNIFCVPLIKSDLIGLLNDEDFLHISASWTKYCGLNLSTIIKYGTIEFRQLRGTYDIITIITWIRLLWRMKEYVMRNTSDHIENMILHQPQELLKNVFDPYTRFLKIEENILKDAQLFIKATMFKGEIQKELEELMKPKSKKVNITLNTSQVLHKIPSKPPGLTPATPPPLQILGTYLPQISSSSSPSLIVQDEFFNSLEPEVLDAGG